MKIDIVLTACNNNSYYYNLYPFVYKVWKQRFNLDLYMVFIFDEDIDSIPEVLIPYKNYIILFKSIPNINTCYIAQIIRLLYPCMIPNKNILITDMDIIPISHDYFINSVQSISDDKFITYSDRYIDKKMFAICYNLANSNIWKKIFKINSLSDINDFIIKNYNTGYTGQKNCPGWYTDQEILYISIIEFPEYIIILQDNLIGYNRLNGKSANSLENIKNNKDQYLEKILTYSDFHIIRNYHKNINLLNDIINKIIE